MTRRAWRIVLAVGAAAAWTGVSSPATAEPSKEQCVDDNAAGQALRRDGRFAAASERLRRCAVPSCPAIVRDDCARRLNDLERAQPSLIFEVKDASGADVIAVRVSMDGTLLTDHLDGTALPVDPGAHEFTFEVPGKPVARANLLIREGEATRHESVVVGNGTAPPSEAPPSAQAPSDDQPPLPAGPTTQQVIGLSLAGVGVVGAVVGTVFGLMASSEWSQAKTTCGGDASLCRDSMDAIPHQRSARDSATVSTVAFAAGGAFLAGGAALVLTGGRSGERKTGSITVAPAIESERVGVVLRGAF